MHHFLTLVANPASEGISEELVAGLSRRLRSLGAPGEPRWLSETHALDLPLEGLDGTGHAAAVTHLADLLARAPIDWALIPAAGRRKRLLVADMESTVIENELLPELADLAGHKETVAALTERAMSGLIGFDGSLRERVAALRGLPADSLRRVARNIRFAAGARKLVSTMKAAGAKTALVSSGFRCFADIVAGELGFDASYANELLVEGGTLTGDVRRPILNGDSKRAILEKLCGRWDVPTPETIAVGDGANDLGMLGVAGLGVAFHGSAGVAVRAPVRVDHGDLTTLLYFQGYARAEFVE